MCPRNRYCNHVSMTPLKVGYSSCMKTGEGKCLWNETMSGTVYHHQHLGSWLPSSCEFTKHPSARHYDALGNVHKSWFPHVADTSRSCKVMFDVYSLPLRDEKGRRGRECLWEWVRRERVLIGFCTAPAPNSCSWLHHCRHFGFLPLPTF